MHKHVYSKHINYEFRHAIMVDFTRAVPHHYRSITVQTAQYMLQMGVITLHRSDHIDGARWHKWMIIKDKRFVVRHDSNCVCTAPPAPSLKSAYRLPRGTTRGQPIYMVVVVAWAYLGRHYTLSIAGDRWEECWWTRTLDLRAPLRTYN